VPAWIPFTLVRVGLFAVVFVVLMLVGLEGWLAAIVAAIIAFLVSYIFFRGMRARVATELADARAKTDKRPDEVVEDQD
jgi:uncharacterized membrane protein